AIPLLRSSTPRLNQSVTTGTLSTSFGSLFYSLFTSFHLCDDYLPILYYRLDLELDCSGFLYLCLSDLLARLRPTRKAALFRSRAHRISAGFRLAVQRAGKRLSLQCAHGSAHPSRAGRSRATTPKSSPIVFTQFSTHSSTYRMDCWSWCDVAM